MMMRLVFSEVKAPVENPEITIAHAIAGHQRLSQDILADLPGTKSR
jgi:hypothetical protein